MEYKEEQYLQLSGIQHFSFCRRQWALIHIENQWAENLRTTEGALLHERAHDESLREVRGDRITVRGVRIASSRLGVSSQCDVLEFRRGSAGVTLNGREGLWQPCPVEYKRGAPKGSDADRLQLCGQAMCLEETFCCDISEGALYYGETRRREMVCFTPELRRSVEEMLAEMHTLYDRGHTPRVKTGKFCAACSLKELCLPVLMKKRSAEAYIAAAVGETE